MPLFFYVLTSTAVFTAIILFLVAVIILIKIKVIKPGACKIYVNDDPQPLVVSAGVSLLTTLANNKIFIPSACGGGGTCASASARF